MPQTDFFVKNLYRSYPCVFADTESWELITDVRFIIRPQAGYLHGRDRVILLGAVAASGRAGLADGPVLVFGFDNPEMAGEVAVASVFAAGDMSDVTLQVFKRYSFLHAIRYGGVIPDPVVSPFVSGWCSVGRADRFPENWLEINAQIEPTCVVATSEPVTREGKTYAFNKRMTQYQVPEACEHVRQETTVEDQYVRVCGPLSGTVYLRGGKRSRVDQQTESNQLFITADGGAGEDTRLCREIPVTAGVTDVDDAPRCNEVLRRLNGVSGPDVQLSGLLGVAVKPHPEHSRLVVEIGNKNLDSCLQVDSDNEDAIASPTDVDGINCGDYDTPLGMPFLSQEASGPTQYESRVLSPTSLCQWAAFGNSWYLKQYPCQSPRSCNEPDRSPTSSDENLVTLCTETLPPSGELIRNPMFTENRFVPHASWDVTGQSSLVEESPTIDAQYLPLLSLQPIHYGESSPLAIVQKKISVDAGDYVLQFDCVLKRGYILATVTADPSRYQVHQFRHDTVSSDSQQLVLGPFDLPRDIIELRIEYFDGADVPVMLGFFSLTQQ